MQALFHAIRPLVLASNSPRRQDFFREQGLDFTLEIPEQDEPGPLPDEAPEAYALRAASSKAEQALRQLRRKNPADAVVIAADTIVTLEEDGKPFILGKPADEAEAVAMLTRMVGRSHEVITACCLLPLEGEGRAFADRTEVRFAPWPLPVLQAYAATGEPLDKAGAYGIQGQGAFLAESVHGSWTTVVGLPLNRVLAALLELGAIKPAR